MSDANGCYLWLAGKTHDGYGRFSINGKTFRAARIVYFLRYGVDPGHLEACHRCDNPSCCRPECLFLGTSKENGADMEEKGRAAKGDKHGSRLHPESRPWGDANGSRLHPESRPRGEKHSTSKITDAQVLAIRADTRPLREVAAEYGVGKSQIGNIKSGESRKEAA